LILGTLSYATSYAFNQVGTHFPRPIENIVAHGVVGGVRAKLQGQKFISGFYGGSFGAIGSNHFNGQLIGSAIAGGVGAVLGGGKFKDGAVTGAYGYLFNRLAHGQAEQLGVNEQSSIFTGENFEVAVNIACSPVLSCGGTSHGGRRTGGTASGGFNASAAAKALGYDKRIPPQKSHFDPHGQPIYSNGKRFITRDVDSHNGGTWKMYNKRGKRLGTYDSNLNRIGK